MFKKNFITNDVHCEHKRLLQQNPSCHCEDPDVTSGDEAISTNLGIASLPLVVRNDTKGFLAAGDYVDNGHR